jgi:streptogramin lyase
LACQVAVIEASLKGGMDQVRKLLLAGMLGLVMLLGLLAVVGNSAAATGLSEPPERAIQTAGLNGTAGTAHVLVFDMGKGEANEISADADGNLWLSARADSSLWRFNPASGVYTAYYVHAGQGGLYDAQRQGDFVWWTGYESGVVGRISLDFGQVVTWALPGEVTPYGVAFDDAGDVWVTASRRPYVYRFDPQTTKLCTYTYAGLGGGASYATWHEDALWLGDVVSGSVIVVEPELDQMTAWTVPGGGTLVDLAFDGEGQLWATDYSAGVVRRMDMEAQVSAAYTVPASAHPAAIGEYEGRVWYTTFLEQSFGVLDPARVAPPERPITPTYATVVTQCRTLGAGSVTYAMVGIGPIDWQAMPVTVTRELTGFLSYGLEEGAEPWDVVVTEQGTFVSDKNLNRLIWVLPRRTFLPLVLRTA